MPVSSTGTCAAFSLSRMARRFFSVSAGRHAAQHVVGAQLQDHRIGMIGQRPVQPRQPAGRGVAGDAGIDDHRVDPRRLQRRLQLDGEFGARRQAIALGQAGAQRQNFHRRGHAPAAIASHGQQRETHAKQALEIWRAFIAISPISVRIGHEQSPHAAIPRLPSILEDVSLTLTSRRGRSTS